MAKIDQINFKGKTALIRADLNVPLKDGSVRDDSRIMASLPSIQHVLKNGGAVVLMSHLGRPQKEKTEDGRIQVGKYSLKQIVPALEKALGQEVKFAGDVGGELSKKMAGDLKSGEVLLIENTRFEEGESSGSEDLANRLAQLGDIFINDAFGTAHRAHASNTQVARYFPRAKKAFGFLMEKELTEAEKIIHSPEKPFTVVLGGAKVSDKILLIEKLIERADHLLIGGGMAYTFILANGGRIGKSIAEPDKVPYVKTILKKARDKGTEVHLPLDTLTADEFSAEAEARLFKSSEIPDDQMGLDIGPKTIQSFSEIIRQSRTLFWNGPMGVFEMPAFKNGTLEIARSISTATTVGAYSLIGGGDSVAAVNKFGLGKNMSYLSTGGGAMLTLLEGSPLPAVEAMEEGV